MLGSAVRTLVAYGLWAMAHSLLATSRVKSLALKVAGEHRRNAMYRISYNAFALVSLAGVVWYVRTLPDRRLYRIPWPWRGLTAALRLIMVMIALRAAGEVGVGSFSGLSELTEYLVLGKAQHEPEAQGPSMGATGLRTGGPFAYVRHPLNASATAIVLLTPEMTVVRLAVAALTVVYAVAGSMLEERRLLAQYGAEYATYQKRVPFFLPGRSQGRRRNVPGLPRAAS